MNYNGIRYQCTFLQYNDQVAKVYVCRPVAVQEEFTKIFAARRSVGYRTLLGRCLITERCPSGLRQVEAIWSPDGELKTVRSLDDFKTDVLTKIVRAPVQFLKASFGHRTLPRRTPDNVLTSSPMAQPRKGVGRRLKTEWPPFKLNCHLAIAVRSPEKVAVR